MKKTYSAAVRLFVEIFRFLGPIVPSIIDKGNNDDIINLVSKRFPTYRTVLEGGHVGLHRTLHVPCCHQGSSQVDIFINKVWLQTHGMP